MPDGAGIAIRLRQELVEIGAVARDQLGHHVEIVRKLGRPAGDDGHARERPPAHPASRVLRVGTPEIVANIVATRAYRTL